MKGDDFKLLRVFADGRTNEQTFVIVKSLLQLKRQKSTDGKEDTRVTGLTKLLKTCL